MTTEFLPDYELVERKARVFGEGDLKMDLGPRPKGTWTMLNIAVYREHGETYMDRLYKHEETETFIVETYRRLE